ncbi:ABC transporter permease [Allokutzneria sp. A3M-2-11 16]|uniref:ABC transporter permease n=1 Tax=Allokutzneria sp. A3M-2-11 16 TaxID=2962043 RepID=UPI0020B7CE2D|nr:ABC transporter permease [Allokutzneria sp. A3M-2-11 16]MCP3803656.1 ABC transporter permease [Allokutzneria sp. A3M-2-11 16]
MSTRDEVANATGEAKSWVLPVIAAALVVIVFASINARELDSIEARLLSGEEILARVGEHLRLVAISTVAVILLAVPLGVLLSRPGMRLLGAPVLAVANAGQAIPSIGILVLLAILFGVGIWMAVISLVLYALLPVLRNTMVGLKQVDRALIDAGRGMGMSARQVLVTIELPLAVPVMLAGIRVALILNVGVATLATYTNAGGLGSLIESGIVFNRMPVVLAGSILTVALALSVDWLAGVCERGLRPRGI